MGLVQRERIGVAGGEGVLTMVRAEAGCSAAIMPTIDDVLT